MKIVVPVLGLLVVLAFFATPAVAGWFPEVIDDDRAGKSSAMALGADGSILVAYTAGSGVRLATWDGTSWQSEAVAAGMSAFHVDLEVGDGPVVAFQAVDDNKNQLLLARRSAKGWAVETVDDQGSMVGEDCDLELDSQGRAHILYRAREGVNDPYLRYAVEGSRAWSIETAHQVLPPELKKGESPSSWGTAVGRACDLAIAGDGVAHAIWLDESSSDGKPALRYAVKSDGAWDMEEPLAFGWGVNEPAMALDSNGSPHVVWSGRTDDGDRVFHGWKAPGQWQQEEFLTGQETGSKQLVIEAGGTIHMSYHQAYPGYDIGYATRDGQTWSSQLIDEAGRIGPVHALALDLSGHLHAVYQDQTGRTLLHATNAQGETRDKGDQRWQIDRLTTDETMFRCDAVVDGDDTLHAACYGQPGREGRGGAYHLSWVGNRPVQEYLGTARSVSTRGLAVETSPMGSVVVLYTASQMEGVPTSLYASVRLGNSWEKHPEVYHDTADVGLDSAMAVDAEGRFHAAYTHGRHEIRYSVDDLPGLEDEVAASCPAGYCQTVSLAVGPGGEPVLAWLERGTHSFPSMGVIQRKILQEVGLRDALAGSGATDGGSYPYHMISIATRTPDGWQPEPIEAASYLGEPAVAVDSDGVLHLLYSRSSTSELIYQRRDAGVWSEEQVTARGVADSRSSLAIGGAQTVHVAYVANDTHEIIYAHRQADGTWTSETVGDEEGSWPVVAVDSHDQPHLLYFVEGDEPGIRYAR